MHAVAYRTHAYNGTTSPAVLSISPSQLLNLGVYIMLGFVVVLFKNIYNIHNHVCVLHQQHMTFALLLQLLKALALSFDSCGHGKACERRSFTADTHTDTHSKRRRARGRCGAKRGEQREQIGCESREEQGSLSSGSLLFKGCGNEYESAT